MLNTLITVALFVVGISGAYITAEHGRNWIETPDFVLTLFQFFVIVVVGGCISFIHQLLAQQREDRDRARTQRLEKQTAERQLFLLTYDNFLGVYDKVKRVRRILRARVLRPEIEQISPNDQSIQASHYDEQMETLIDAQLEFESIELRMRGHSRLFANLSELDSAITRVRTYLHATVEEYQDRRTDFDGEPPQAPLAELPALLGLIGSYGRDQAWKEFNEPFQIALRCLRLAIQERSGGGLENRSAASQGSVSDRDVTGLGAQMESVRLFPHNWEWSERYNEESARLSTQLGRRLETIEHVGSTAVRGVWAIPVIDMLARVTSLGDDDREQLEADLAAMHYERCTGPEAVDLAFSHSREGLLTHSLYLFEGKSAYFDACVELRNRLDTDLAARRAFDSRKRSVASSHTDDPDGYHRAKTELLQELREEFVQDTGKSTR